MNKSLMLAGHLPTGSMESYISAAYQLPMLSAEEEHSLALRLRDEGDVDAARALVMPHLRFVIKVARGYSGYGLAQQDLIQEGTIGLMKAVKRFDPDRGVRLVSFAVHWIKAEIHEFVLRNWRIVKVATTKAQRKLFFNLRSRKKRLGWFSKDEIDTVAEELGVKPEIVVEMEKRLNGQDIGYDGPDQADDEQPANIPASYLSDIDNEPGQLVAAADSQQFRENALHQSLQQLDDRSREILQARWLNDDKATLHQLAERYGVSAERIRQIEKNAMKKLKTQLAA